MSKNSTTNRNALLFFSFRPIKISSLLSIYKSELGRIIIMGGGGGKKSSARYGLKKTIACATTVAALASSASARRDTVDGAAFLETFDDGLDGWVKSEVEQYTGASSSFFSSSSSLCVFSRARREFVWRFLRLERVLNRSKSRGKDCGASCIEFRSEKKKRSRCRSLSYRSNETTACQPKVVTMDRAKSIDRRVPMTQSSNEYACLCFCVCVCARKSACASNPPGCFLYEDSPKATLLFLPFVFDNNNNNDKQASWKSRTKTGKNS